MDLVSVSIVDRIDNFPIDGTAYAVVAGNLGCQKCYAFVWGSKYPYEDEIPSHDIKEGESGIEWYESESMAFKSMNDVMKYWEKEL